MTVVRARNPLTWLRWVLFALGVLAVASVAVLVAAYRFGSAGQEEEGQGTNLASPRTDERTVTAGEGFDYTQMSENRQIFRIRADRSRQDREDTAFLETVELEIFRNDGDTYKVTSDHARVNQRSWAAELQGNVEIIGVSDLELTARALRLQNGGQVMVSVGAVEFRYPPNLVGRATALRLDRGNDTIHLTGGVAIRSVAGSDPMVRMDCERLVYRRGEGVVEAAGEVYVRQGGQELRAFNLSIFLEDDQKTLRSLRASFDVRGRLATSDLLGDPSRIDFAGQKLTVETVPGGVEGLRDIELEGDAGSAARVKVVDAGGLARQLTGSRLESQSRGSQLQLVEGFGSPLVFAEFLEFDQPWHLRQACAGHATARFLADGSLGHIELEHDVELRTSDLHLSGGARADLDLESGQLSIEGDEVELFNARGSVLAPKISYHRDKGIIRASAGVRASLEETDAFEDTLLGRGGEGPIRVESEEAFWTREPPGFSFRGGVRAWRGPNLLLADQLRGDETLDQMAASGNVKTVWIPGGGAPAGGPPAAAREQPIEVHAEDLSYRPSPETGAVGSTVTYTGGVRVRQESRSLSCRELSVELAADRPAAGAADGAPQRMICRRDVVLADPVANREVRGDLAIYAIAEKRVEVLGERVELIDESENSLAGRYLLYDLEAGTMQLKSRPPGGRSPASSGG